LRVHLIANQVLRKDLPLVVHMWLGHTTEE